MAPKHHPTPLSGGDRKALNKELGKAVVSQFENTMANDALSENHDGVADGAAGVFDH
jgi:hypothetical protein